MTKKAIISFALGVLSILAFFAVPRSDEFMIAASRLMDLVILLSLIAISFLGGISAFLLGRACIKQIPAGPGMGRMAFHARSGRAMGIVGSVLGIMMAYALPGYRQAQIRSKISRDRQSLRVIETALTSYIMESNRIPPDIQALTRPVNSMRGILEGPFLKEIPKTAFARNTPVRLLPLDAGGGGCFYIAWTPGPDGVFDIDLVPELKSQLKQSQADQAITPWIEDRWYDITNGTYSKGDIVRINGLWTNWSGSLR